MVGTIPKTVTVRSALESAWTGVVKRSKTRSCNECFTKLFHKKTLAKILDEGDLVLHLLEPKQGYSDADLPDANAAGRDIGLHPALFFDSDPLALTCTLIHELAHVGGASTDAGAPRDISHAAENTLPSCGCEAQYRSEVLGSIKLMRSVGIGGSRYA
ncbi:MAG TPA: hypothetical protein VGC23_00020, partial [Vicinamibacterales bacterium]